MKMIIMIMLVVMTMSSFPLILGIVVFLFRASIGAFPPNKMVTGRHYEVGLLLT